MAILTVGTGEQYAHIADAVSASHDGDVIQVQAGTYVNDFATIVTSITIEGVGGMAVLEATVAPPDGKAILTTYANVTIDHLAFTGAQVPDGNGAGIRYGNNNLTITNSYFYNNQDGILGSPIVAGTGNVSISNSEFAHNGAGDGYTHNLYIGDVANLTIDNSYFHDAVVGHEIKSRAENTTITNSRIDDGRTGTASYSIDLPNGGAALIANDVIQQGPDSQNAAIIAYGEEGSLHANSSLTVRNTTVLNDLASGSASAVWNTTAVAASVSNDSFYGLASYQILKGVGTVSGSTMLSTEPALATGSPWAAAATVAPGNAHTLVVNLSEDAFQGDALASVSIDGSVLTSGQLVTAIHAAGATQALTFTGPFGAGAHVVTVGFLNDAYAGAGKDRNLYVDGLRFDGAAVPGASASLYSAGTATLAIPAPAAPVTPAPPAPVVPAPVVPAPVVPAPVLPGTDTLTVQVSEDAYRGDAQFAVSVDGHQVGGTQTAIAAHSQGLSRAVTLTGSFGAGPHSVGVTFLNDLYDGGGDRNLYVSGVALDGVQSPTPPAALFSAGTATFVVPAAPPPATDLVLNLSEDMFAGDAQFIVSIDGRALDKAQTVTASHALGQTQAFDFAGTFGIGPHDVAVTFLNDAYAGAGQDRNLYVDSVALGGVHYAAATASLYSNGTAHLTLPALGG